MFELVRLAILAAVLVLLLPGSGVLAADNVAFAQQRYARGVQLYDGGDFDHAASEFEQSLQLYESPNSRLYLARAYGKLNRLGEAMVEYQRAERESAERAGVDPRYAATRDAAAAALADLRPRVAHVVVKVAPGPTEISAKVQGRPVPEPALGLPIAVTPGTVEVAVTSPGHLPFRNVISTRPGEDASVYVTLLAGVNEGQQRADRLRTAGWLVAGAGAAGLLVGGAFGILAQRQYHDLVSKCGFTACVPPQPGAVDAGRRWERLMDVSLMAGGVVALGGGVLLWLAHRAQGTTAQAETAQETPGPTVGWDGRALILEGRF